MTDIPEFRDAGEFLRQKRKEQGFKTQKSFIAALLQKDPDISCSESYVSLIEKGVKTPGVHLLDVMAQVLEMSAAEKGELLLTYKRVPSDFEFAVRDNLKASAQITRLDEIRRHYAEAPNREHFNRLLKALVLEELSQEAMDLLKKAPTFENELLELQQRTARMASLSGNYDFAKQAFELALDNCRNDDERAEVRLDLGILAFQQGLKSQNKDLLKAMEAYVQALAHFEQSLRLDPEDAFAADERTRCYYHLGDGLLHMLRSGQIQRPSTKDCPALAAAFDRWCGKKPIADKLTADKLKAQSQAYFRLALEGYANILSQGDRSPLPDKPMREAVYFHAYTHGKLKLFATARVLLHSNLILDRNWLTWFMKAGLCVMEFEHDGDIEHLDGAIHALTRAMDYDADTIKYLVRLERDRELTSLWKTRPQDVEALLTQHEES
ncbi:MAG: hypothetical protein CVV27_06680 [Candidatus Melainabacteria bacterium HGW-Melainabacteria-1]|nr:MAG: hypothetical protein CVV27_06680 [Candidatus Melainabacteria bacterium HGW-Melainabacteria-1]